MRPTPQPIAGASGMNAAPPPAAGAVGLGKRTWQTKFSQMVLAALSASRRSQRPTTPPASTGIDGTGKALTECQDTSCLSTSLLVKQPEELTTTSVTNNEKGTTTTADSDSTTAVSHNNSHLLHLIVSYACRCCDGGCACMKWCALNMNEGQRQLNVFVMNIGCTSRGPTTCVVCGDHSFSLLLCFCVAVCAAPPLVCARTFHEGCRHDGPLSPCVHAVEPCVPLLFASPFSICVCVCCGRAVCVCVAMDWSVCRAWCAAYGACVAAALSSCGVPSVCGCYTSRLPCCSPCPSLCRSAPHH
ncbi:trans-sialidase, putative [Trypanosoma cruzi]|nr:trans-sialidase, putative [Trypanosoma cruzi]